MKSRLKIQNVISIFFSFLLSIFIFLLILPIGFSFGVFNDHVILRKVNESNYYNEVQKQLADRAETIISSAGLPDSVLSDVITLERVYVGGKYYIEDTLAGKEPIIKTDSIRKTLSTNIDSYLDKEGIKKTEELDSGIKEIITKVEQEYRRGIEFQFIHYLYGYKVFYQHVIKIAVPILILLIVLICFMLIRMQKYKHRGIRYITYAVISSTIITMLTASYLSLSHSYDKINVSPEYYDKFLTNYLKWDIQVFLSLGGMGVLLSILLLLLVRYMKKRQS